MSLTATADHNVMNAENQVHKLFLRYVETIAAAERTGGIASSDWFASWNRDAWVRCFGEWVIEYQRKQVEQFGASND